ncbi:MAG: DUF523 domain-containing protein [Cellulosilyticaceae bacterium]
MYLVSACLVGTKCRYDGESNRIEEICRLVNQGKAIPVCPEQLGGLQTPRIPAERVGKRVITKEGEDVTEAFMKGAYRTVAIAKACECQCAIMKAKSPSCGCGQIYNGEFEGKLLDGDGVAVELLKRAGIKVYTEQNYEESLS